MLLRSWRHFLGGSLVEILEHMFDDSGLRSPSGSGRRTCGQVGPVDKRNQRTHRMLLAAEHIFGTWRLLKTAGGRVDPDALPVGANGDAEAGPAWLVVPFPQRVSLFHRCPQWCRSAFGY